MQLAYLLLLVAQVDVDCLSLELGVANVVSFAVIFVVL